MQPRKRIIVGCEQSGVVRRAFRALGHVAFSCDLLPAEDKSPFHFKMDILELLKREEFDLGCFFPPCDYLTVSGNRWFSNTAKAAPGILTGQARRDAQVEAVAFVLALWNCTIKQIAIENPIGRLSTLWRKPTQIINPFNFGDPFRKTTCLWLSNLPPLIPTSDATTGEQACWKMAPSADRKRKRAVTYPGFAREMARQWGTLLTK